MTSGRLQQFNALDYMVRSDGNKDSLLLLMKSHSTSNIDFIMNIDNHMYHAINQNMQSGCQKRRSERLVSSWSNDLLFTTP